MVKGTGYKKSRTREAYFTNLDLLNLDTQNQEHIETTSVVIIFCCRCRHDSTAKLLDVSGCFISEDAREPRFKKVQTVLLFYLYDVICDMCIVIIVYNKGICPLFLTRHM